MDRNTILVGPVDGRVFRTTSGGRTWQYVADAPGSGFLEDPQFVGSSGDVVFARQGSSILRSLDTCQTWRTGRRPAEYSISSIATSASRPTTLYLSTVGTLGGLLGGNGVWRSRNGGDSWQLVDEPRSFTLADCCGLTVDPNDQTTVYASVGVGPNTDGSHIRRTTNGGLTWVDLPIPTVALSFSVLPTDLTTLLAQVYDDFGAGRFVLLASTDRGEHWTRVGTGLPPNARLTKIVFDSRWPARLFSGTYGRGAYRSGDSGVTWQPTGRIRWAEAAASSGPHARGSPTSSGWVRCANDGRGAP